MSACTPTDGIEAIEGFEACREEREVGIEVDMVAVLKLAEELICVDSRAHEGCELVRTAGGHLVEECVNTHIREQCYVEITQRGN